MQKRNWMVILGLGALVGTQAGLAGNASADPLKIFVTAAGDGYHHDELGTAYDYFTSTATSNQAYYSYWGTSDTLDRSTAYAQFSLTGITTDAPIVSATLNFYLDGKLVHSSGDAGTVKHVANSSSANGNASQKLAGNELALTINTQAVGWVSVDVTSFIQSDLDKGYKWSAYSFHAYNDWFGPFGFGFKSAESGSPAYLSITTIPEPMSAALLGAGGIAMLARRKRA